MTKTIVYTLYGGPLDGLRHELAKGWEGCLFELPGGRWAWYFLIGNRLTFIRYETCFDG